MTYRLGFREEKKLKLVPLAWPFKCFNGYGLSRITAYHNFNGGGDGYGG